MWGLEEDSSHFGILFEIDSPWPMVHSSGFSGGITAVSEKSFYESREKVAQYGIKMPQRTETEIYNKIMEKDRKEPIKYDWRLFFWLVWRGFLLKFFRRPIPQVPEWHSPDADLCSEIIKRIPVRYRPWFFEWGAVTPHRIYIAITNRNKVK